MCLYIWNEKTENNLGNVKGSLFNFFKNKYEELKDESPPAQIPRLVPSSNPTSVSVLPELLPPTGSETHPGRM